MESLTSIFKEFFASNNKIFILGRAIDARL